MLVDMPGYGFANAPVAVVKQWQKFSDSFLQNKEQKIKRLCILVDSRHGLTKRDIEFLEQVDRVSSVPYQIVLTKADKVKKAHLDIMVSLLQEEVKKHPLCSPEVIVTSAGKYKDHAVGLEELRTSIVISSGIVK